MAQTGLIKKVIKITGLEEANKKLTPYMTTLIGIYAEVPHIMITLNIGLHILYYETCNLLSSTKSQTYDKDKGKCVKAIISFKYLIDSNIFLF